MSRLYRRLWRVRLGTLELEDIAIAFKVAKDTSRQPNKLELEIRNLAESTRAQLEVSGRGTPVRLEVGYRDEGFFRLFDGQARTIETLFEAPTITTKIEARDAGDTYRRARVNRSYAPMTPVATVLRDLADSMDVGVGNLMELAGGAALEGGGRQFPEGTVVSGQASQEFDRIVRSMGLRWSIQDGVLQLQQRGRPLNATAVLLAPDTGLVGSPTKEKKLVKARSLLQPGLYPGRRVDLRSRVISGGFEVRSVEYVGNTESQDWYCDLTLRAY